MRSDQIIAAIIGLAFIAFIVWWFFGKHEQKAAAAKVNNGRQEAKVVVHGGYTPATIILKKGVPADINFDMRDSTACLSHVVFDKLGVNADLTKKPVTSIKIPTGKKAEYDFACGMNMFHGKVIVK